VRNPVRFAVIGSGWRSAFFLRMAAAAPDRLEVVGVLARRAQAREQLASTWGVPTVASVEELLRLQPEFVAAAVTWEAMPEVTRELVAAGVKVLVETPPAPDLDGLRSLWHDVGSSGLVQVAEQYMLMPGHAARLEVVRRGVIGAPHAVQVGSTHLYHAVSMMRAFLGADAGTEAVVTARRFEAPMVDPLTPAGWVENPEPSPRGTTIATIDFGESRMGLYDFVDNQWWNPVLARRILVRGSLGEIADEVVRRLTVDGPITSPIVYRRTGIDLNLEGNDIVHASFDGEVVYRNPWVGTRLSEDDIAVASILEDTGRWARGDGPAPYPLADGCQDHAIGLAIGESARTGADVRVSGNPWG